MIDHLDENRAAAASLAVGFAAMLALLYRDPAAGLAAATVDGWAVVSFVVLPVAGLLAGAYVAAGGPYETVVRVVFGTYLGIVGVGVTFGALLSTRASPVSLGLGVAMLGLGVVALATIALRLRGAFGLLEPSIPSE